jgi:2-oxoglutarate dehydrogenase E1 component
MYQIIQNRPATRAIYQLELEAAHDITLEESEDLTNSLQERLLEAFKGVKETCILEENDGHAFAGIWSEFDHEHCFDCTETGVKFDELLKVATALTTVPDGFKLNRKVGRRLPGQLQAIQEKGTADWALGELRSTTSSPARLGFVSTTACYRRRRYSGSITAIPWSNPICW